MRPGLTGQKSPMNKKHQGSGQEHLVPEADLMEDFNDVQLEDFVFNDVQLEDVFNDVELEDVVNDVELEDVFNEEWIPSSISTALPIPPLLEVPEPDLLEDLDFNNVKLEDFDLRA